MRVSGLAMRAYWAAESGGNGGATGDASAADPAPAPDSVDDSNSAAGGDPPSTPATEGAAATGGSDPDATGAAAPEDKGAGAKATEPQKKPSWEQRRIDGLTARNAELQRQLEAYRKGEKPQGAASPQGEGESDSDFEARVAAEAARRAVIQKFNSDCNNAVAEGQKNYGSAEFDGSVKSIQELVDRDSPESLRAYNTFLAAALETGAAPKLLYEIGQDKNLAMDILAMPQSKMLVELTKMALRESNIEVSGAPKPITPVGRGQNSTSEIAASDASRSDHLSTAEWMRRRNAEVQANGRR